jgi:arginine/lysine/ornithine decarboxylase
MADAEELAAAFTQLSELHPPHKAAASDVQPEAAAAAASSRHRSTATYSSSNDAQLPSNGTADQQHEQQQPLDGQPAASPLSPRDAFFADTEVVPLAAAAGRVCAELLCPYPPGVPLLFPGEVVSGAAVQQLQATLAGGGVVTGAQDATLQTVLVVVE